MENQKQFDELAGLLGNQRTSALVLVVDTKNASAKPGKDKRKRQKKLDKYSILSVTLCIHSSLKEPFMEIAGRSRELAIDASTNTATSAKSKTALSELANNFVWCTNNAIELAATYRKMQKLAEDLARSQDRVAVLEQENSRLELKTQY